MDDPPGATPASAPAAPSSPPSREAAVRDHLANERTLLAWQRTALAMVGLGFVVDRFAFQGEAGEGLAGTLLGMVLILAGALAAIVGVWRYLTVERQIDTGSYRPAVVVHLVFSGAIVVGAVALVGYLLVAGPD
jgi:putative membrane protein